MPALTFSKWSPGGNTTLFFPAEGKSAPEQARLARLALDPQHLGGDDPLRLVGQHVVVKVVWPLNGGLVQQLPQERYPVAGLGA